MGIKTSLKIISAVTLFPFIFSQTVTGSVPRTFHEQSENLSVEIISQKDPMTRWGNAKQTDIFKEVSLVGSILSIAEYLLTDPDNGSKIEYLECVLRGEINEHLDRIDLGRVKEHKGVVLIPYKYGGREFIIQAAVKGSAAEKMMAGEELKISDKYSIKVIPGGIGNVIDILDIKERPLSRGNYAPRREISGYGDSGGAPLAVVHGITCREEVDRAVMLKKGMVGVDIQLTRDNVPVVYPGKLELPGEKRKYIREFTLEELEENITGPLFKVEDLLRAAKGRIALHFDIKDWVGGEADPYYERKVAELLDRMFREFQMSEDIYITSSNPDYVRGIKKRNPSVFAGISTRKNILRRDKMLGELDRVVEEAKRKKIEVIVLYPEQLDDGIVDRIHRAGLIVAVNTGGDISPRLYKEVDMIYVKRSDLEKESPRVEAKRNALEMSDEEILNLIKPEYAELRKHAVADWMYARTIASAMGIEDASPVMNMLRVICLGHDVGGILGYRHDEDIDRTLLTLAGEKKVPYIGRDLDEVINEFSEKGVDLEEEYREFVKTMDHGYNSIRIMRNNGIESPGVVESVIAMHMGLPHDGEEWGEVEKLLFSIFVVADVFECGNCYYKQVGGYYKHEGAFESPEHTLNFLKFVKFKNQGERTFDYMKEVLETVTRMVETNDTGFNACIEFSRKPLRETIYEAPKSELFDAVENNVNSRWGNIIRAVNDVLDHFSSRESGGRLKEVRQVSVLDPVHKVQDTIRSLLTEPDIRNTEILPGDIKAAVDKIRENCVYVETDGIIASMIILGRQAKNRREKLIIGLEIDWVPGYERGSQQHYALNPIILEILSLGDTLKKFGLDNIEIVFSSGTELADDILERAEETGTSLKNIIVLASESTIASTSFRPLMSTAYEEKAFLAGIDPALIEKIDESGGEVNYIDIIRMLLVTLELARGKTITVSPIIKEYSPLLRKVIFLPKPELMDLNQLKLRRDNNLFALQSA